LRENPKFVKQEEPKPVQVKTHPMSSFKNDKKPQKKAKVVRFSALPKPEPIA